ncbi:MAG: D-TA family PLP-dependent enzyme [bacterium]|nr:D-TA family PLP-dependent enzyme [bacterium]
MNTRFDALDLDAYRLPESVEREFLSPCLVVFLDHVRTNLQRMLAHTEGRPDRWRPHIKTTKLPEVYAELLRAGVRCFKCATPLEARRLLERVDAEGVEDADLLVAYPLAAPSMRRVARLAAQHPATRLSVLCEDPAAVAEIDPRLGIFVDVNPGMDRTGVPLERRDAIAELARRAGERFRGLHFYDGHLHGLDVATRRARAHDGYRGLNELRAELETAGMRVSELITSGTPSFLDALAFAGFESTEFVHRVSPGTVVFHDLRSEQEIPDLDLVPAALVLSRVVSRPAQGLVTCDAGSKSIAAEAGDPCAYVLGRPELRALAPSEEHLPLSVSAGHAPPRGTTLLLVPRHVCPTVNLAREALLVEGGRLVDVVPVAAGAHETGRWE